MKKVFFLVNSILEWDLNNLVKKYFDNVAVSIGEVFPPSSDDYDLIIFWAYRRIVQNVGNKRNIILFHSSDLPKGRGWAPLYYAFSRKDKYYTISGILPADKVDSGEIIVKARFQIKDYYTAEMIRKWDYEIGLMLIRDILINFDQRELSGIPQDGEASYYERRQPKDNEIPLNKPLNDLIPHLRGCEERHPAFFYYNDVRYNIRIEPDMMVDFPDDLIITYFDPKIREEKS